jgi:RHH-type proline utilization regulon transcriptional repressor/proline dehydrogenase/delta 1-pyrroline-5-carboxylate dehydrogenase
LTRRAEGECVADLLRAPPLAPERGAAAARQARQWIEALRDQRSRGSGVDALMRQFSLSSQEGVALMCLAEALARIPDRATADALIRDKLAQGDWQSHIGASRSIFVNAAAWGLMLTGKLVSTHSDTGLTAAVNRLIARGGEPLIRAGVDIAMRLLGQQFVLGKTIELALERARDTQARGYRHSYDMLGEAALTEADAQRYLDSYAHAIAAIGASADTGARALQERPGISVKLSALHPRFSLLQRDRLLRELLPRIRELCAMARRFDLGLNIDAEESERLEPTLDLFARLAADPGLADWDGLGIVVQAYQRRAVALVDWLAELAALHKRRWMVRLVKGAYWDSEIKRAQVEGQVDFPVFTRKVHTDLSYQVCAQRLLARTDRIFPQFATHNALTLATVLQLADAAGTRDFELQCLHGMGETLYDMVVGPQGPGVSCRIYAPVGSHETLLAYLVRRLLENGANSSFVNRVVDEAVSVESLLEDPRAASARTHGTPHPSIVAPGDLYAPERENSKGIDLHDPLAIAALDTALGRVAPRAWTAFPILASGHFDPDDTPTTQVRNPARRDQVVGSVHCASARDIESAFIAAGQSTWHGVAPGERADLLDKVAQALQARRDDFVWLAIHEAGKTVPDAFAEVREAIDFCRYYAQQLRLPEGLVGAQGRSLGTIVAISPWNFPLAIFTGQIAAALAAGNAVLAKPAEQTPLIAALAVRLMHAVGIPPVALQLLPGDGAVGARLVQDPRVRGVLFTGSSEVAALIDRALANAPAGIEPLLVAETGGQNAMIVDSSAQPEQIVQDAIASAFGSAGQRCSALRVLCLQEEIADSVQEMLVGAAAQLRIGRPERLATDLGPVIDEEARASIEKYLAAIPASRFLFRGVAPRECEDGTFVAPAIVSIASASDLRREVFGPVLHVLRYERDELPALLDELNATGYALTCGVHSRIDETIDFVAGRVRAGNVYVNRNIVGAVVGTQPFGGEGLSGTGPKAGGPWTVPRLQHFAQANAIDTTRLGALREMAAPQSLGSFLHSLQDDAPVLLRVVCEEYLHHTPIGCRFDLPGPTGESNVLTYRGRGRVLCMIGHEPASLLFQLAAVFASDNRAICIDRAASRATVARLPQELQDRIHWTRDWSKEDFDVALCDADETQARELRAELAKRAGARVRLLQPVQDRYALDVLVAEQSVAINTAAAGGNASLMTLEQS